MEALEFRALLDLFMVSDPWILPEQDHIVIEGLLDQEAQSRGFDTWVDAYHEFKRGVIGPEL